MSDDPRLTRASAQRRRLHKFTSTSAARNPNEIEIIEWLLATTLAVTGAHMIVWPEAVQISHMRSITSYAMNLVVAGVIFSVGMLRIACLLSKTSRQSVRARAILSCISVVIWGEMVVSFWVRWRGQVYPPGFYMLTIMQFIGELWLVLRIKRTVTFLRSQGIIK